jgi:hypothetical protein
MPKSPISAAGGALPVAGPSCAPTSRRGFLRQLGGFAAPAARRARAAADRPRLDALTLAALRRLDIPQGGTPRETLEATIEALIGLLDALDGDADFEAEPDAEADADDEASAQPAHLRGGAAALPRKGEIR